MQQALSELDLTEGERAELLPTTLRLAQRDALTESDHAKQQLVSALAQTLFPASSAASPVRLAIQGRARQGAVGAALALARAQIDVLHPFFWILSIGIVVLGGVALSSSVQLNQALLLQTLGPLLAYLGASCAFRGMGLHVLECELACPPSLVQVTLARLIIVLGYDLALGLGLSWFVSAHTRLGLLVVLAHWLMPLLLVTGVALALSAWLPITLSAALAYGAWLGLVVTQMAVLPDGHLSWTESLSSEIALGVVGVALLILTLVRMRARAPNWLPHV